MKKNICLGIVFILIIILIMVVFIKKDQKTATNQVNSLFYQIFTEGESDYEEMINTQSEDVEQGLYKKYGDYFTSNGWNMVTENRIISLGIKQYQQMNSVPQDVKITITERKNMESWYVCQIKLIYPNEKTYSYIFTVQSVKEGNSWLVEYIAR